jgi:hypothetical protein
MRISEADPRLTGSAFQALEREHDAPGGVVDVEELAGRVPGAPEHDLVVTGLPGFDASPDHRRDHVARVVVEVVARAVQVRRDHEGRVEPVLLAVRLRLDQEHLLREAVGGVRLLRVAAPQVLLSERDGRELRVRAHGADDHELADARTPRLVDEVDAHHGVREEEASRVHPVRADAADDGRRMDHAGGLRVLQGRAHALRIGQVVVRGPGHDRLGAALLELVDDPAAEEPLPVTMTRASRSPRPLTLQRHRHRRMGESRFAEHPRTASAFRT